MRSLHYQIVEEPDGREIRYRFSDDYKFTPPTLTPSELATLLLAQESIAATD
jgi:predicted DNA-binding transcriptional regulator YafY